MKKIVYIIATSLVFLTGCDKSESIETSTNAPSYPQDKYTKEREKMGSMLGKNGLSIGNGEGGLLSALNGGSNIGISINPYLWRASLEVAHKMPLLSADPFGGTIITDWYKINSDAKERYRLNILLSGAKLTADGVQVAVLKQVLKGNTWVDVAASDLMAEKLEEEILLKARKLRFRDSSK